MNQYSNTFYARQHTHPYFYKHSAPFLFRCICLTVFLLMLLPSAGKAQQGLDSVTSVEQGFANVKGCVETEVRALYLIPVFFRKRQFDSIELVLDFVNTQCYESPSLRIARLLLAMQNGTFRDTLLLPSDFYLIKQEAHALRRNHLHELTVFNYGGRHYLPAFTGHDWMLYYRNAEADMVAALMQWTHELSQRKEQSTLERSLLAHLMKPVPKSNEIFAALGRSEFRGNTVRRTFRRYQRSYNLRGSWNITLGASNWRPDGELAATMGGKGGFQIGFGYQPFTGTRVDLTFGFHFGRARRHFLVVGPDSSYLTRRGRPMEGGIHILQTIWRPSYRFEINALGGFGSAETTLYRYPGEDKEDEPPYNRMGTHSLGSLYLTGGFELRFFIYQYTALLIQGRRSHFQWDTRARPNPLLGNANIISICLQGYAGGRPHRRSQSFFQLMRGSR